MRGGAQDPREQATVHTTPISVLARQEGTRSVAAGLLDKISTGDARIAIIGLGYVGLPLALAFARSFTTVGIDVDPRRVESIRRRRSYVGDIVDEELSEAIERGAFSATHDFDVLKECDCVVVCVPTPLEAGKLPDLSCIVSASEAIAQRLHAGQLIVLESTTYPGTTDEMLLPLFSAAGFALDEDFLLAFSPERVDPGNRDYKITDIPKIVGGCSAVSTQVASALYRRIVPFVHEVSSARVAETAKLWENTFRAVNIALANEMSMLCQNLGIESSEVIEAAATKPFGFMPFYPGPGVGGHCIPLDPHYLSWTASKHAYYPRFIMLADQINSEMSDHIVALVADGLNDRRIALRGARILVLGVTYKADVADTRMSPAIPIIERLRAKGVHVRYHDPFVPRLHVEEDELPPAPRRDLRESAVERRQEVSDDLEGSISAGRRRIDPLESRPLTDVELRDADCVLVITAHTSVDYDRVARLAVLVVDSRNVVPSGHEPGARIISL